MLNNISWTDYFAIVSVLVVFYYCFIGLKFYSLELRMLFSRKRTSNDQGTSDTGNNQDQYPQVTVTQWPFLDSHQKFMPSVDEGNSKSKEVEELSDRLKEAIEDAVTKNYLKEEFILSINILLRDYRYLKGSPLIAEINNVILSECENYGYVRLNAQEQGMLWNE